MPATCILPAFARQVGGVFSSTVHFESRRVVGGWGIRVVWLFGHRSVLSGVLFGIFEGEFSRACPSCRQSAIALGRWAVAFGRRDVSVGETLVVVDCFGTVGPFLPCLSFQEAISCFSSCWRLCSLLVGCIFNIAFCRRVFVGRWDVSGCACLGPIDSFPPCCLAF